MTGPAPPRLALWLLARCLRRDDPLAGDLIEEFATGRSRSWFWRQALGAAAVRGPLPLRLAACAAVLLVIGPAVGYAGYAHALMRDAQLPMLVERLTIEQMVRSVRTDDVYAPLRFRGGVVEVTGVLTRVLPASPAHHRPIPALYVTSSFDVPEFGAVFLLSPSADIAALAPGDPVTLRCPVLDQRVSQALCLVFQ